MKVLFVVNNFYAKGNGLSFSAQRTVKRLKEAGVEIKILSGANPDKNGPQPEFLLKDFIVPIFNPIVRKQGYSFSAADETVITEAVLWADVVHIEEPFSLQMKTCKIAEKLGKPLTGTYHLHPENLFASVKMDKSHILNDTTMWLWKKTVFNKCKILQCPTENTKERLVKNKFKPELRVISNGLILEDLVRKSDVVPKKLSDAKYTVITIGRYSVEKNTKTLLKAMKYSKFAKDIQLIYAGRGPYEKPLKKLAAKITKKGYLKYPPIFSFYPVNELQTITAGADLYIHCAFIEVEGLSCMEAIQMGIVPVIAKGKFTATSQFALSEQSTFREKDAKDLAAKIDFWLSDDDRRNKEAEKYVELGKKYDIDYSIKEIIKMFEDAMKK